MDPLTIATAAFGAIKQGVSVGKELHSLSGQIIKFVKQMNVVEEEHKKETYVRHLLPCILKRHTNFYESLDLHQ